MFAKHCNVLMLTSVLITACDEVDELDPFAENELAAQIEDGPAPDQTHEFALPEEPAAADDDLVPTLDVTSAPRGIAAGCGKTLSPSVNGGAASWSTTCEGGWIRMKGWVKDTSIINKCAWVRGEFADGTVYLSEKACGNGVKKEFNWSRPGSIVDGYLIVNYP